MTPDKLKTIIAQKEGTEIEFKKSQDSLARSVYESICAFLNRRGGHVVLGAKDNGEIVGINPAKVQEQMDQLAKDMNNPQLFKPTYYLSYEPMDIDGKKTGKKTGKELEDVIKEAIRKDSSITIQEFQKLTGLSKNGTWNVLNRMKEQNKIKRIGPDKGGHWEVVGD